MDDLGFGAQTVDGVDMVDGVDGAAALTRRLYRVFAEVLDYPGPGLVAAAAECAGMLAASCPEAAEALRSFAAYAEGESPDALEEVYTRTFDVTPTTHLYVGYHLFGESYKRGAFLSKLQEAYQWHGFSPGSELADHLCVLLRFAADVDDPEFVDPLFEDGIVPALAKVESAFGESKSGYALAVGALRAWLGPRARGLGPGDTASLFPMASDDALAHPCTIADMPGRDEDRDSLGPSSGPCPLAVPRGPWPVALGPIPGGANDD